MYRIKYTNYTSSIYTNIILIPKVQYCAKVCPPNHFHLRHRCALQYGK